MDQYSIPKIFFVNVVKKNLKGISLINFNLAKQNLSLDLCANCIAEIAHETKEFRF